MTDDRQILVLEGENAYAKMGLLPIFWTLILYELK